MAKLSFELDTKDWVWLCEVLAEMTHIAEAEPCVVDDVERMLSTLSSLEAAV